MADFDAEIVSKITASLSTAGFAGDWIVSSDIVKLSDRKGTYILLMRLNKAAPIAIKRLRTDSLSPGAYLYAGNAYGPGGLAARLKRHFRKDKKVHWHVDRLTVRASELAAIVAPDNDECAIVEGLVRSGYFETALKGFGSSDCSHCESHLLKQSAACESNAGKLK